MTMISIRDENMDEEHWVPEVAHTPERLANLDDVLCYIRTIDFEAMKSRMASKEHGGLGWSRGRLNHAEKQYKNWLCLRRKHEGMNLPPAEAIDEFWHWHILDTRAYHRDMMHIFGYYLHHFPYFGVRSAKDQERLYAAFDQTQRLYLLEFGEEIYDFDEGEEEVYASLTLGKTIPSEKRTSPLPCFIHINKNAGHTVRALIHQNCSPGAFFNVMVRGGRTSIGGRIQNPWSPEEEIVYTIAAIRAQQYELDAIATNIPFGIDHFIDRPLQYFTFMREPVSRAISHWYFAYNAKGNHALWKIMAAYDFQLQHMLTDQVAPQFMNDQIRTITGSQALEVGEEELRLAKELIQEQYLLVGTVEQFDPCIAAVAKACGWKNTGYTHQNVGNKADASLLPWKAEQLFQEANEWDLKLYNWVENWYLPHRL